jgi:putative oxidoreductase
MKRSKGLLAAFWISTAIFALQMSFTAYYELANPQVGENFARLGFSNHAFHVELSVAKVLGVLALLVPMVPARGFVERLKEWAYAGFAINLISAFIAHLSMGDGPKSWSPSAITSVLWGLSYLFFRRLQTRLSEATDGS